MRAVRITLLQVEHPQPGRENGAMKPEYPELYPYLNSPLMGLWGLSGNSCGDTPDLGALGNPVVGGKMKRGHAHAGTFDI
jgi:hypothetical protein